jgi:hypothetical protein
MTPISFELLRVLAMINGTDTCHFWFLRDKLVSPIFRSTLHCRSVDIAQYDEAARKLLDWRDKGYYHEVEFENFKLTFKGMWMLHVGVELYGDTIYEDWY